MFSFEEAQKDHLAYVDAIDREARQVYLTLVLPHWGEELHGFPYTLYGYMMTLFARIDLLSAYWAGDASTKGQTLRMIDFMDKYMSSNREANSVAVQMWRHKLMHTSEPRNLLDERTNKVYRWLLHWGERLPADQHYTFAETSDSRILNLGLLYLIEDLRRAVGTYLSDLSVDPSLQSKYEKVKTEIASYKFRLYS